MAEILKPEKLKDRKIQCVFTLQSGVFKQGYNTKTTLNNTINAVVKKTMNNNFTNGAQVIVYGMNSSDIAALTTLGYVPLKYNLNKIKIYAQYDDEPQSLCFSGYIVKSWPDYSNPSRPMYFECSSSYFDAIQNQENTNIKGQTKVTDILNKLSSSLGLSLQNNGVEGVLNNTILTGSYVQQLQQLSSQLNINCVIDKEKLKVSQKSDPLEKTILNINKNSGLISYPTPDTFGVKFKMRYNPVLNIGQYIYLQTKVNIPKAIGKWFVYDMEHSLSNRRENWYTDVKCSYNNFEVQGNG